MQRHCENGEKVAAYLRQHPKVARVYWCGFSDHPNHDIAKKQMRGFGGMMSFTLKDDSIAGLFKGMVCLANIARYMQHGKHP
jgi:cystathionine gamma-lyase